MQVRNIHHRAYNCLELKNYNVNHIIVRFSEIQMIYDITFFAETSALIFFCMLAYLLRIPSKVDLNLTVNVSGQGGQICMNAKNPKLKNYKKAVDITVVM